MSSKKHEDDEDDKKAKSKHVQEAEAAKGRSALAPDQPVAEHMAPSAPTPLDAGAGAPLPEVPPPGPRPDPPPHGSPSEQERYADMKAQTTMEKAQADAAAKAAKETKEASGA